MGLGRPGACPCGKMGGWSCLVGLFSRVWLACPCWYRRHTLCCLCLVVVGAPFCVLGACGGGMLSGFWGSAPWVAWLVFCCLLWVVGCGCGWVGCELYSGREHLTVRFLRQMFLFCSCVFVVCFFERSVDALASGADEGRGGLRYSSGSRLAGCDPRVSEWGDPARVMSCHLHLNCIGCGG